MNKLNIFKISAVMLMALYAAVSCDEQYDYYKVGKNNPTVRTLDVSEEQVGETWVTLIGSVKWEQSTSDHSFDCRFAISESPDFPAGESDTLYNNWNNISQEDTTTHYYDCSIEGLKRGTTYYYAFSITDDIVEVSGETKSFTTLGQAQDDPDNPTDAPRLVIEPEYYADAIGGDQSVPFIIENYDTRLYGELIDEIFLVERIEGGDDWITDLGYGGVEYGEDGCSGYVHFIVAPNEAGYDRSCMMSVRLSIEGVVEQEEFIYISQPSMSVEEPNLIMREGTEFSVDAEGGDYDTFIPFIIENYSYEYFESHGEPALWIENGADWLSNVEYAYLEYGDDCTGYINLTAAPNTSGSDRTGNVTFGFRSQSYSINITQAAKGEGPIMETDFIISVTKITNSTAHVEITPKDTEIPFLVFVGEATKVAGLTDDELFLSDLRAMQATAHDFGMTLPDYVDYIKQIGYASGDQTDLSSATEYAVWCYHIDNFGTAPERISNIVMNTFTTD